LCGIAMRDSKLDNCSVGLHDVYGAPVGDVAGGELSHLPQSFAVVERARERVAGGNDEGALILDALAVVDVRRRPDPEPNVSLGIPHRQGAPEVPAVTAVGAPEAVFHLEGLAAPQRLLATGDRGRQVVGMDDL